MAGLVLGAALVGSILVIGAFIVAVRALREPRKPPPPRALVAKPMPPEPPPAPEPEPPPRPVERPAAPLPPIEPERPLGPPPPDPAEVRRDFVRVQKLTNRLNLAGLVAAVLQLTGRADPALRTETLRLDREIRSLVREHERHPEFRNLPARFEPGDTITGFENFALSPTNPKPFADRVSAWLRGYQPGSVATVTLSRQGGELMVPFYFPERGGDLQPLLDRVP
jgi:hypothetical protein